MIDTLTFAVPLWIDRLASEPASNRDSLIVSWAADAADAVSSHGDVLQYGGKPGEAAAVFNATARGLAALAHCPGGITFYGVTWCSRHHPLGLAHPERDGTLCPECGDASWIADWTGHLPPASTRTARTALQRVDPLRG